MQEASSEVAAPAQDESFTIPLSVNGEASSPLKLSFDAKGYTGAILDSIAAKPASGWHFLLVETASEAKLTLSLSHYPVHEFVLHRDSSSGVIEAGLRRKGQPSFVEGLVASQVRSLQVWDKDHLQAKAKTGSKRAEAKALPVSFGTEQVTKLRAEDVKGLAKVRGALRGKDEESAPKWWLLREVLGTLDTKIPRKGTLVVHYLGEDDKEQTVDRPLKMLWSSNSAKFLVKVNRRGQWKMKLPAETPGSRSMSIKATSLEILPQR